MLVQYRNGQQDVTRRMFAPARKVQELESWYKQARQAIPQIPPHDTGEYELILTQCTPKWISWEVYRIATGERCYVVIDRQSPGVG